MTKLDELRQRYAEADGQPITRVRAERFQSIAEDAINKLAWVQREANKLNDALYQSHGWEPPEEPEYA